MIEINGRSISAAHAPYVVAELSANHNGSLAKALASMDAAKKAGADAIKIQTYTAQTMTIDCERDEFMIKAGPWNGLKLFDLYKSAETPYEWHSALFEHAKNIGLTIFSTPFDESAVDLLEELQTPAYKIASFELTDLPLIKYVASKGKPMIMSTGLANESEIKEAVDTAKRYGSNELILLHCVSSYPAPVEQTNLRQIANLAVTYNVTCGLSDHSLGITAAIASVALGACFIEKHFTLDRDEKGPDSDFSIEPDELAELCLKSKEAWLALGRAGFERQPAELNSLIFRRSIYFVKDLPSGHIVKDDDIRRIRPGMGLPPKVFNELVGKSLRHPVCRGQATAWDCFV